MAGSCLGITDLCSMWIIGFNASRARNSCKNFLYFRHPVAVGFHLSFKALALLSYLLGSLLSLGFVINFIIVIILLAMDFWTTKNVSGKVHSSCYCALRCLMENEPCISVILILPENMSTS